MFISNMKRIAASLLAAALLAMSLPACAAGFGSSGGISVVCTIFPQFDWTRRILGELEDEVSLTLLLDSGIDLHSYQPSADDIIKISSCDLLIYVGGESESWIDDALREPINDDMVVINLLRELGDGAKEEEIVEGMEHEQDHEHDDDHDHEHDYAAEYDEHIWLSLGNAEYLTGIIAKKLGEVDPENADAYAANAAAYIAEIGALDAEYRGEIDSAARKTLLFGDRFPFRYLTDDYGLDYYAAFPGCSAETEASFNTIAFLARMVDELNLSCLLTIEGSSQKIAETIVRNTQKKNQKILTLDSMQSITPSDIKQGATYLSIMKKNLDVLIEALR